MSQTYPSDLIEWIVIDDGSDKVEDLFKDIPGVKYYYYNEKLKLGKKRNLLHEKSSGDIIVYMDDDDYYPPDRIKHAVTKLNSNAHILAAGSSHLYIYFKEWREIYSFGPYGKKHATAGTFAFKRKLLKETKYDDNAEMAEEISFLKNYTIPLIQLDPIKTILVFCHNDNTFDKKKLVKNSDPDIVKKTKLKLKKFIKNKKLRNLYISI
jgi:glycosyltransferase involved in cell wall biosynthesis